MSSVENHYFTTTIISYTSGAPTCSTAAHHLLITGELCIKLDMAVVVRELGIKLFIEGIIGVGRCQVSMK